MNLPASSRGGRAKRIAGLTPRGSFLGPAVATVAPPQAPKSPTDNAIVAQWLTSPEGWPSFRSIAEIAAALGWPKDRVRTAIGILQRRDLVEPLYGSTRPRQARQAYRWRRAS